MRICVITFTVVYAVFELFHLGSCVDTWDKAEALSFCQSFEGLYEGITNDLRHWPHGIDRVTMDQSINKFTTRGANKGIALAFMSGIAYVVEATLSADVPVGHHAGIFFTYMQVIFELQRLFGDMIPDVEFVIASSDRPMVSIRGPQPYPPVFRFCSSDVHADIMIPIFHFYTKKYSQSMLDMVPANNLQYPWGEKKDVLFGRFSNYYRTHDATEQRFKRLGGGGCEICKNDTNETTSCRVRQHFHHLALRYPAMMDVKSSPKIPMLKHAQYKYLLHLDGQALSSRVDLLLPLNSLLFKEESGYKSFYYHLLKPEVHYIPVWKKTPDDIVPALEWAKAHDKEAQKIAESAQDFALKYLNKRARTCYWYKLLVEFSKLLKYKVSPEHEVAEEAARKEEAGRLNRNYHAPKNPSLGHWRTVEEYLKDVPHEFEGGKWYNHKIEEF
ncbi:hypothetical protein CEUSTIGMA_g3613.t1 [Chlamydomonas eustigma]|uniref:Glycosyl transferase CAP10 domain-containing protein n=1 Tax=Chlamydomonas eustigma TaxID=1157962 RepID=A0A250WZQ0_9CHLO|nr:hypothetical protein CEUSTIGMA_g3613.t1 [Chlamydomonas eustigma]|eukprot:GAX76169.1 hypothetical protein CEUSTIGMA_g3613.t1 [Chlamydomonas eustigma]